MAAKPSYSSSFRSPPFSALEQQIFVVCFESYCQYEQDRIEILGCYRSLEEATKHILSEVKKNNCAVERKRYLFSDKTGDPLKYPFYSMESTHSQGDGVVEVTNRECYYVQRWPLRDKF